MSARLTDLLGGALAALLAAGALAGLAHGRSPDAGTAALLLPLAALLAARRGRLRALLASPSGRAGAWGVGLLVALAALAPLLAPFDPLATGVGPRLAPPGPEHLLGTDVLRRDVLSRLVFGARLSVGIGVASTAVAGLVGTALGLAAGLAGGAMDRAVQLAVDVLVAVPRIVVLLAVLGLWRGAAVSPTLLVVGVLGLTGWMGIARVVRAEARSLRRRDFVLAARGLGLPGWRVALRHVLPHAVQPAVVHAALGVGYAVLAEAALSFLGLGVPPPAPSWGAMVDDGRAWLREAPWLSAAPGAMVAATVLAFNLLGEGVREALDPRGDRP